MVKSVLFTSSIMIMSTCLLYTGSILADTNGKPESELISMFYSMQVYMTVLFFIIIVPAGSLTVT